MSEWIEYFEKTKKVRNLFRESLNNKRLIELIVESTPENGRILEVGCGTAILSLLLADCGFDVTASDLNQEMLDYARNRMVLKGLKLNFIAADMFKLSSLFPPRHFDTICHKGVMEHFSDKDIVRGLMEQRKVSHKVVFCVPNNRAKLTDQCFGDERLLNNRRWKYLIKEAGFTDIKVFGRNVFPNKMVQFFIRILPVVFFGNRLSFWWKYFSKHSLFVCE